MCHSSERLTPAGSTSTKELKVLGAGWGRTGTWSMKDAVNQLGLGPCYHMIEILMNPKCTPDHMKLWMRVADGGSVDWDDMLKNYNSTMDMPASMFYKQLLRAYPDAKVVLTSRDPEAWWKSMYETVYQLRESTLNPLVGWTTPAFKRHAEFVDHTIWEGPNSLFKGRFADKDYAIKLYFEHIEDVRKCVPPEQLLIFDVSEGWEPLCKFLGVPVPDTPFPHVNNRNEMLQLVHEWRTGQGRITMAAGAACVALLAVLAARYLL